MFVNVLCLCSVSNAVNVFGDYQQNTHDAAILLAMLLLTEDQIIPIQTNHLLVQRTSS